MIVSLLSSSTAMCLNDFFAPEYLMTCIKATKIKMRKILVENCLFFHSAKRPCAQANHDYSEYADNCQVHVKRMKRRPCVP
jgi:hypothetical protein